MLKMFVNIYSTIIKEENGYFLRVHIFEPRKAKIYLCTV